MDVVLGHPYSGALYGYFSDQEAGEFSHTKTAQRSLYYRTLYGSDYQSYVELALNFLLLYEKVWITPADNHMPRSRKDTDNRFIIPELGLNADWEAFHPFQDHMRENYLDGHLGDPRVQHLLGNVLRLPRRSWSIIIQSALYDAGLAIDNRCPLLCSKGRRMLIELLIEIDQPTLHPDMPLHHGVEFIESYQRLTGLSLRPKSIDDLMDAKFDRDVRAYGDEFLRIAMTKEIADPKALANLIRNAKETHRVSGMVSGVLKWSSVLFSPLLDFTWKTLFKGAKAGADYISAKSEWYEFSGSIESAINSAELDRRVNELLKST